MDRKEMKRQAEINMKRDRETYYSPSAEKLKELFPDDQEKPKMDAWNDLIKALNVFGRAGGTRQEAFDTVRQCIDYTKPY